MKITLPENISDITLGQFQRFTVLLKRLEEDEIDEREFTKRKVELFAGVPSSMFNDIVQTDVDGMIEQIDLALGQEAEFKNRFTLNGIEFGFVPNFDNITSGEYFDLSKYGTEADTLHNLMAVLFRPIKIEDKFGNYSINKYKGSGKYSDVMKNAPLHIVNGALVFFLNLSRELEKHIQRSMEAQREKDKKLIPTLINGVG
jgi:hypothetical protein